MTARRPEAVHAGRRGTRGSRRTPRRRAPGRRARRGRVFVISSPSGGGKTTVVERVKRRLPALWRSVSVTTRAPRQGERRGRDYRFLSVQAFRRMRREGALLEWARVHGAYYGTPRAPIERALAQGRDVILNIDVQGARQIRQALPTQAVLLFLMPPSVDALRRRLLSRRTDTTAAIRQRLRAAKREVGCVSWYDYSVVNDRLEDTVDQVAAILTAPPAGMGASYRMSMASDTKGVDDAWRRWRLKSC